MFKIRAKIDINSQKFYKQHPDLAPRNVYLATGRVVDMRQVNKIIDEFGKESFLQKCVKWFRNFKKNR